MRHWRRLPAARRTSPPMSRRRRRSGWAQCGQEHQTWGQQHLADALAPANGWGLLVSPNTVPRVLRAENTNRANRCLPSVIVIAYLVE